MPTIVATALGVVTIIAMILLRPTGAERPDLTEIGINALVYDAHVDAVGIGPCTGTTA